MRVMGLQSGTSMDGIDVIVVDFAPRADGLDATVQRSAMLSYPAQLRAALVDAAGYLDGPGDVDRVVDSSAGRWCELDAQVGAAFAEAASEHADAEVELIAILGQTVHHRVVGGRCLGSLQIGQPATVAHRVGVPVLADLRAADIAVGGHGAPLAPLLDEMLLRDRGDRPSAAINIGGVANITVVTPDAPSIGYDTGPGNALLDAVWARAGYTGFDTDGALARTGHVHDDVLARWLAHPYFRLDPPKSTGKEMFDAHMVPELGVADALATATELTARTIADALTRHEVDSAYLSGGGARNGHLVERIARCAPNTAVDVTDVLGVPIDTKEALLAALIGWLSWHGLAGNHLRLTGAEKDVVLGNLCAGGGPLRLPEPLTRRPRWLRIGDSQ